ncbi:MAG: cation transporter [Synergistaceae bacterium]|nr:cation transporter [Synergistaceae bacterium]
MKKRIFNIKGMFCFHCLSAVVESVRKLNGVKSVEVGLEKKAAIVEYNSARVSTERIRTAIQRCGFTVVSG